MQLSLRARSALMLTGATVATLGVTAWPASGPPPADVAGATIVSARTSAPTTTPASTTAPITTVPVAQLSEAPAPPDTEPPATTTPRPPAPSPPAAEPAPARIAPSSAAAPDQAARGLGLLNSWRRQNGLAPLAVASDAQSKAQAQAERMAAERTLSHSNLQSGLESWNRWAENVGFGASADAVQQMFQDSAGHNKNMLAADMTNIGIGAAWGSDGNLYICQEFVG